MSTFSMLMQALAARVPMQNLEVTGQEGYRVLTFISELDGKERSLEYNGYPEESEIDNIVEDLICHFNLPTNKKI